MVYTCFEMVGKQMKVESSNVESRLNSHLMITLKFTIQYRQHRHRAFDLYRNLTYCVDDITSNIEYVTEQDTKIKILSGV